MNGRERELLFESQQKSIRWCEQTNHIIDFAINKLNAAIVAREYLIKSMPRATKHETWFVNKQSATIAINNFVKLFLLFRKENERRDKRAKYEFATPSDEAAHMNANLAVFCISFFSLQILFMPRKQVFRKVTKTLLRIAVLSFEQRNKVNAKKKLASAHFVFLFRYELCLRSFVPWPELSTFRSHIDVVMAIQRIFGCIYI